MIGWMTDNNLALKLFDVRIVSSMFTLICIQRPKTTQLISGGAVKAVLASCGANCVETSRFLGASRPCRPTGWLALLLIKAGDVETNPGPTTHKQVWICDICHKRIHGRKQISIRCNMIEHWVHLRCAVIRLAQYSDTWTCHLHKESRLTDITPHNTTRPCYKPPTHSPLTPPQPKYRHISKPKPNPLIPSPHTPPRLKHIHISHTPTPLITRTTLIPSTSAVLDTIPEPPTYPALNTTTPHPSLTKHCSHPCILTLS